MNTIEGNRTYTTAQATVARDRTELEVIEERLSKHVQSLAELVERVGQTVERLVGPTAPCGQTSGPGKPQIQPGRIHSLTALVDDAEQMAQQLHELAQRLSAVA